MSDLTKSTTDAIQKEIANKLKDWGTPVKGAVAWYNDTDEYVTVYTYDQNDALRWIAYESKKIAPKQSVYLRARGEIIQIYVENNGATYDCKVNSSYNFDGIRVIEKEKK